jgi:transcriptional regulator with XRE-family HTH domain
VVTGLRDARLRRRWTQLRLARAVGVDVTSVQRWEQDGRAPSRRARRLAEVLEVDLAMLARPALVRKPSAQPASPLRRLRRRRNLSSRLVAARAGITPASLLAWERGCATPSWGQARAVARALAVPAAEVFSAVGLASPRHLNPALWTADDLPEILSELRRWQGWTQQGLAELLGVGAATLRSWERGRQRPRRRALERLDELLGITPRLADVVYPRSRR